MKIDPHKGVSLRKLKTVGETTNFQREKNLTYKGPGTGKLQTSKTQEVNGVMPLHF